MNILDLNIIREKTLCVSGHRSVKEDLNVDKLKSLFLKYVDLGIDTFLIGMAVGYDTICFRILEKIRRSGKNIRIICCIPCPEQDKFFSEEQKTEYKRMIDSADFSILLENRYTPYCMMKRNKFMVDNSSVLIAYLREKKGGTKRTVDYAKDCGIEIIFA